MQVKAIWLASGRPRPYICPMIDLFRKLTGRTGNERPAQADERTALAALLVEAAHADGSYDAGESARIARVLATRYGLSDAEAAGLRGEGEAALAQSLDLVQFTRAVKKEVPHEARVGVIEAVWEVVYADGVREMHESALIRKLCGLLHIEDRESGLARQRVAARLGIE
ncbi:MAG: TerB family tellurite resistance protein [Alphaproteobacteria bacterium]